jgi:hypothetical protein
MQAAEGPEETVYEASMAADQRLLEPPPPGLHPSTISPAELASFHRDGFISLGRCAPLEQIEALGERIDDIMMGTVRHANPMLFQLCPSATDLPQFAEFGAAQTKLWKGATLKYRKVQDLEQDPLYRDYMSLPVFRDITSKIIGPRVSLYRTMFFNKVGTPSVKVKLLLLVTNPTNRTPLLLVTFYATFQPAAGPTESEAGVVINWVSCLPANSHAVSYDWLVDCRESFC